MLVRSPFSLAFHSLPDFLKSPDPVAIFCSRLLPENPVTEFKTRNEPVIHWTVVAL